MDDKGQIDAINKRVIIREPELEKQEAVLSEYTETTIDRIILYVGLKEFPEEFNSIAVEVVLAMYRRKYHEGISTEGVDAFNTTFVNNLLSEYDREFNNYKASLKEEEDEKAGKLVFL